MVYSINVGSNFNSSSAVIVFSKYIFGVWSFLYAVSLPKTFFIVFFSVLVYIFSFIQKIQYLYLIECIVQSEHMCSHGTSEGADQRSFHSPVSGPEEEEEELDITSSRDLDNGDIWQHSSGSGGDA